MIPEGLPWLVDQLSKWASDQREREGWKDEDRQTYGYRAELLEGAVKHLNRLARIDRAHELLPARTGESTNG